MRPADDLTLPRLVHPVAWWAWAVGLAVAASRTTHPFLTVSVILVAALVVAQRRDPSTRNVFGMFLVIGGVAIGIRLVAIVVFGGSLVGDHVLFTMPELPLPAWTGHLRLGGAVTLEGLQATVFEGLKLTAVLACLGAANALASPRRLLRYVPATLYEIGTAVVVGLTWAPQLAKDAGRVRAAQRLRGRSGRSLRDIGSLFSPVLASALDRSLELAASMESRGYGRTVHRSRAGRSAASGLALASAVGVIIALYGVLSGSRGWLGLPLLAGSLLVAATALAVGARRDQRSAYRRDPWALPEWLVLFCGLLPATVITWGAHAGWPGLQPPFERLGPGEVPVLCLAAVLWAAAPAFLAPAVPQDLSGARGEAAAPAPVELAA